MCFVKQKSKVYYPKKVSWIFYMKKQRAKSNIHFVEKKSFALIKFISSAFPGLTTRQARYDTK